MTDDFNYWQKSTTEMAGQQEMEERMDGMMKEQKEKKKKPKNLSSSY